MPKATKKKKEKVEDFKVGSHTPSKPTDMPRKQSSSSERARSRPQTERTRPSRRDVGRRRLASTNAAAIALPSQKPLARALANKQAEDDEDDDGPAGEPTTAAGLTIDDVLIQLRHANAGVRREAVHHLKEVLVAGMNMGIKMGQRPGEVAKVVRAIGGLIADDVSGTAGRRRS